MPIAASIVIADGATTPVNHTFVPSGINGASGTADFTERTDGVFVGEPELDVIIRPVTKGQVTRKATLLLKQPKRITETDGSISVAYENLGKIELTVSASSTTVERTDLRVLLRNALGNALIASALDNMEPFYG